MLIPYRVTSEHERATLLRAVARLDAQLLIPNTARLSFEQIRAELIARIASHSDAEHDV